MSALGQKQTCAAQKVMSALPPKADMCSATSGCPLSANSGLMRRSNTLFDHLIGAADRLGQFDAERLCGFKIDHQLNFRRLLTGMSAGFSPLRILTT